MRSSKKEIEDTQKSDAEKKAEAITTVKQIIEELNKKPSKDEKRSGSLWGIGIGGIAASFSVRFTMGTF